MSYQKPFPSFSISAGYTDLVLNFQGTAFGYQNNTIGLFLSASVGTPLLSTYNFFSNVWNLSAKFPPFNGLQITNYQLIGDDILIFNLPFYPVKCLVDFVFVTQAGYNVASMSPNFNYIQLT